MEKNVLILVLVEHTLGDKLTFHYGKKSGVLILVLVEHTLGALIVVAVMIFCCYSLNPCFSGTYSRRMRSIISLMDRES